jgi:hypothetical protein
MTTNLEITFFDDLKVYLANCSNAGKPSITDLTIIRLRQT